MDNRNQQIREGAGLEESRLNTEFIDFIQKWGGPFLILCAVAMGGWAAWNWWTKQQAQKLDIAFAQYEAQIAGGNPNPAALEDVAREFQGVASVSLLARLDAADIHLAAARSGVRSGATLNPDGTLASPDDAITEEDRTRVLAQASALYQMVYDEAFAARGKSLLAIKALYGLAAVAECKGEIPAARDQYQRIVEIAEAAGLDNHAALARARSESLDRLASPPVLLATASLPQRPAPPTPELPPLTPEMPPDTGPVGPVAPSLLDQPLSNPFNPEPEPSGLPNPLAPPATAPGGTPGTPPDPAPTPPGR